jgi:chromosome segregation ATPase
MIGEKQLEIIKLKSVIQDKDDELLAKDDDTQRLLDKQQQDLEKLATTGGVNLQDEVFKMLEQKVKDTNEVLSSKVKVIEVLQGELGVKDKKICDLEEKLQVTAEQLTLLQENFVAMETQWKEEKHQLAARVTGDGRGSSADMQQLQAAVAQYENAYAQIVSQYQILQAEYNQLKADKSGESSLESELLSLREQVVEKSEKVSDLERRLEEGDAGGGSGGGEGKRDAKFIKYKAQATAKIKALEKQLAQMNKVSKVCHCLHILFFSNIFIHNTVS